MTEEQYSFRELNEHFSSIDKKLDAIIAQTSKTNGRVSTLEISNEKLSILVSRHNGELLRLWEIIECEKKEKEEKLQQEVEESKKKWGDAYYEVVKVLITIAVILALLHAPDILKFI